MPARSELLACMSGGHGRVRKSVQYEDPLESVPTAIRVLFEPADIKTMFEFMENRYHLSPKWRQQFYEELKKTSKDLPEQAYFFQWADHYLNVPLRTIVYREGADIIEEIALYIMRDRIREKKKEADEHRLLYRGGGWKR